MARYLSLLPDKPKILQDFSEDEDEVDQFQKRRKAQGQKPGEKESTASGLYLSLLPDQPALPPGEPEITRPLPGRVIQPLAEAVRRAAPGAASLTEDAPGSTSLKYLQELYGLKARLPASVPDIIESVRPPLVRDIKNPEIQRLAGDRFISALKGAIGVPETAVGLADLVTGGVAGNILQKAGFDPGKSKDILTSYYSNPQKKAFHNVAEAKGILNKTAAVLSNPSVIEQVIIESVPTMLAAGVVSRGLKWLTPGIKAVVAGAVGEGTVTAGSLAEQVRQASKNGLLSGKQSVLIGTTGTLTGGIGVFFGKLAKKLGIVDVDTMLAGALTNKKAAHGLAKAIIYGSVLEGFEEFTQSVQEQIFTNIAQNKPWENGVDDAAVLGAFAGVVMGGGAQVAERTLFTAPWDQTAPPGGGAGGGGAPGQAPTGLDLSLLPDKPATMPGIGGRIAPVEAEASAAASMPPEAPAEALEGELTAYETISKAGPMTQNFIFPAKSNVEKLRTKKHKGDAVYQPQEVEQAVKDDYITPDLNIFHKSFSDLQRKADAKPIKDTPTLFLDFDDLKTLNSKVGRTSANQMFQGFTRLLNEYGLTAYRWGGDEFAVALNPINTEPLNIDELQTKLKSFQDDLSKLTVKDKQTGEVLHTGMSVSGGFGLTLEEADAAAESAKKAGKNQITIDKKFAEKYNPNYEWKSDADRISIRPGEAVSKPAAPNGSVAGGSPTGPAQVTTPERPPEQVKSPTAKPQTPQVPAAGEPGSLADEFGAIHGPNIGLEGRRKFLNADVMPTTLPSDNPNITVTFKKDAGSNKIWVTAERKTKNALKPQASAIMVVLPDGSTVLTGSFSNPAHPDQELGAMVRDKLIEFIEKYSKPSSSKPGFEPTATYTPLLEELIPQGKKTAGEVDVVKFVKKLGKVNPNLTNSGDIRELDDPSLIDEKNGKSLDMIRESLVESGYLPKDGTVDDAMELLSKQKLTGEKQYPSGTEVSAPRAVSSLKPQDLDQAIKDFEALKAKRPLTEAENDVFSDVREMKAERAQHELDLSLLPDQPAAISEAGEPEIPDISREITERLIALSKARAQQTGEPYQQVFDKALSAYREVVKESGDAGATKLVEATERSLQIKPGKPAKRAQAAASSGGGAAMRPPAGGGAAMSAPSSKPLPEPKGGGDPEGQEGAEPPKNPVWPGAPNDFVPHIEMPEAIHLWRMIMGDFPALRRFLKALAYFMGVRGKKLARMFLGRSIFKDPVEATKILAHEIGHWIDWMSDYILARGNILGRLKSLKGYRMTVIDPLPSANDAVNPLDRKKIMTAATKEALSHTDYTLADYIKSADVRQAMKGLIKETYDEMVENEIRDKGLVTKEKVMAELKAVTNYWHPFDPTKDAKYTYYRYQAKELYAEAVSMLFNEPLRLKEMAPTFYKVFFDNLEKKPEIKKALLELDEMLASEKPLIQEQRAEDVRLMFEKGEKLWYQKRKERYIKTKRVWLRIKSEMIDKDAKIMEDLARIQKTQKINPEDNPKYYMDAHTNIGGVLHNLVEDIETRITDPIRQFGVTEYDLGSYALARRIIGERTEIANPLGFNRMTAPKELEFLRSKFSEIGRQTLDASMKEMSKITQEVNQEFKDAGLATPEAWAIISKNDVYAPFQFLDYLQDWISASVIKQVGGLGEIANPFTSWVMKMIAMKRAIYRENIRKKVVNFYLEFAPESIEEAKYRVLGMKGEVPIREPVKKDGSGIIEIHNEGRKTAYYVDPYIADAVNYQPFSQINAVLEVIRWSNRTWFKPIQTGLNLRYQTVNLLFRDFPRQWKTAPGLSFYGALKRYFESIPDAASAVWGKKATPIIREMRELGILGMTYNDLIKGMPEEETQLEYLTRRFGIGPQKKRYKANLYSAALNLIGSLGEFEEILPKVVGYKYRTQPTGQRRPLQRGEKEQIVHEVQVYSGSPLFSRRGTSFQWYNEIYPYSNAKKEGIRGDLEAGFADPNTRAGYWWKTAAINLLPTLIKWLAAIGVFGYTAKKIMDGQTEYTKTNYHVLPWGLTRNGQSIAITIPQDDMGGIISGLFWKILNADKNFLKAAQEVSGLVIGQKPGTAVLLEMFSATIAFAVGQPHYDYFHGKTILTRDEQEVGGWIAARQMGRWYLDKLGLSVKWGFRDKAGDSTLVKTIKYAPFLNFFIRITDRGYKEQEREKKEPFLKRKAERRIMRKERKAETRRNTRVTVQ